MRKLLLLSTLVFALFLSSCTKDENAVSGKITYKSIFGIADAGSATVILRIDDSNFAATTKTDSKGNYSFSLVPDGTYYVYAELTGLVSYSGKTETFEVKGKDEVTKNLELK